MDLSLYLKGSKYRNLTLVLHRIHQVDTSHHIPRYRDRPEILFTRQRSPKRFSFHILRKDHPTQRNLYHLYDDNPTASTSGPRSFNSGVPYKNTFVSTVRTVLSSTGRGEMCNRRFYFKREHISSYNSSLQCLIRQFGGFSLNHVTVFATLHDVSR
ncbi:hypothetical protein DL98DRAFT_1095 [Cadophora sp. DSE1049]|nr:hypothetical protein DL98DRAFT_1095 [Cadophora sp. DSE1049]